MSPQVCRRTEQPAVEIVRSDRKLEHRPQVGANHPRTCNKVNKMKKKMKQKKTLNTLSLYTVICILYTDAVYTLYTICMYLSTIY